jgi:hypothetical protein
MMQTVSGNGNRASRPGRRRPELRRARLSLAVGALTVVAALTVAPGAGQAQQPPGSGKLPPTRSYPTLVTPSLATPAPDAQNETTPVVPPAEDAVSPAESAAPTAEGSDQGALPAQPDASAPAAPPQIWLPRGNAVLQALDKVNAQTANLTVPVGQSATYGSLTIAVKGCVVRPPGQPQDAAAFLDITDSRPEQPGFSGWVLHSAPSISMLQHPIYDVRVVDCGV